MLSYFGPTKESAACRTAPPVRPGHPVSRFCQESRSPTTVRRGSPEIKHLMDEGFQAFNAGANI